MDLPRPRLPEGTDIRSSNCSGSTCEYTSFVLESANEHRSVHAHMHAHQTCSILIALAVCVHIFWSHPHASSKFWCVRVHSVSRHARTAMLSQSSGNANIFPRRKAQGSDRDLKRGDDKLPRASARVRLRLRQPCPQPHPFFPLLFF